MVVFIHNEVHWKPSRPLPAIAPRLRVTGDSATNNETIRENKSELIK